MLTAGFLEGSTKAISKWPASPKSKRKRSSEEQTDGSDDAQDLETVKSKFDEREEQKFAGSPNKVEPSLCVKPGSMPVNNLSQSSADQFWPHCVTDHEQSHSTSADQFESPPPNPTNLAFHDMHQERLGLQQGSSASAAAESKSANAVMEADQFQPEPDLRASISSGVVSAFVIPNPLEIYFDRSFSHSPTSLNSLLKLKR